MSSDKPYESADIRIGEVIWSKTMRGGEAAKQKEHLSNLAEMAETGVILDCAFVELANSELLNMLVRVRTLTKKTNKGFALFNVSESLRDTIKVCNMGSVLPTCHRSETTAGVTSRTQAGVLGRRCLGWRYCHCTAAAAAGSGRAESRPPRVGVSQCAKGLIGAIA